MKHPSFWLCILVALVAFWASAHAGSVTSADITYRHYLPGSDFLEVPVTPARESLELNLVISPISPLYWQNRVHLLADASKVSWVGWQFEAGLRIAMIDVFAGHHSQHALDGRHPLFWPNENNIGLRWRIYP